MVSVRSFPPVVGPAPRMLVLGSMPGMASLRAQRYYAHPQNAFWPIVGAVLGFDPGLDYAARLAALTARGVALWDVLRSCERHGSLDSAIAAASMRTNDFAGFFAAHPGIRAVLCNGGTAWRLFQRLVLPELGAGAPPTRVPLPSTSPAHAGMPRTQKLAAWRRALEPHLMPA